MADSDIETDIKPKDDIKTDGAVLAKEEEVFTSAAGGTEIYSNLLHEKATIIFMTIGIPPHINGYHFLREAVKLAAGNFEMINSITKKLYPMVAQRFNTTASTIEQGIRNAINVMWSRGKISNLNNLFGLSTYEKNIKPSNGELIALLAEKLYLDCTSIAGML